MLADHQRPVIPTEQHERQRGNDSAPFNGLLQSHTISFRILMAMMKSGFSGPFLLLLLVFLSSTVSGLGSVVWKRYSYIQSHFNWHDAQRFCKTSTHYTDLATIATLSDENLITMKQYSAWIGLNRVSSISWKWSDGALLYPKAWAKNEPDSNDDCVTVYYTLEKFYGTSCDGHYFFYCHKKHPKHYEYNFIPQSKTWSEAQQYCRNTFDDLATFITKSHLYTVVGPQDFPVWIGLHREAGSWKWSSGSSKYRKWASGEPRANGDCVTISSTNKTMATQDCSSRFPVVCYRDNLVLVKENKTWEEALEHCRGLQHELLSVQPGQDHEYVMDRVMEADTEQVWTGLRFLAGDWMWINGASLSYPDLPLCPALGRHCGVLSKNDTGSVEPADCSWRRNFLCYS